MDRRVVLASSATVVMLALSGTAAVRAVGLLGDRAADPVPVSTVVPTTAVPVTAAPTTLAPVVVVRQEFEDTIVVVTTVPAAPTTTDPAAAPAG